MINVQINENDNISDDVIDGVINCTSVMRKCLFVNKCTMVDVNTCTVQKSDKFAKYNECKYKQTGHIYV